MKKKPLKYVDGLAAKRDELAASLLIADALNDFPLVVSRTSATPQEYVKSQVDSDTPEIQVLGLCVESSKNNQGTALNVRVYDYLTDGKCLIDINFPTTHEEFLKGCGNLARKLKAYLRENRSRYEVIVKNPTPALLASSQSSPPA